MSPAAATLHWSDHEPPIDVPTVGDLDRVLDEMTARCRPDRPTIVRVTVGTSALTLGLGSLESFVQLQGSDDPPYRVTVGDKRAQGALEFYFFDEHHTEIPRRNLIPASTARQIAREFYDTGLPSKNVSWEDV